MAVPLTVGPNRQFVPMRPTGRIYAMRVLFLFASLAMLPACSTPIPVSQGRTNVMATYDMPHLSAVLPVEARVPAVIAAAEATVRARGYAVVDISSAEEIGKVVARPPRTSDIPTVRIESYKVFQGTKVVVTFWPWGDNAASRSILDGILQRLGL